MFLSVGLSLMWRPARRARSRFGLRTWNGPALRRARIRAWLDPPDGVDARAGSDITRAYRQSKRRRRLEERRLLRDAMPARDPSEVGPPATRRGTIGGPN